MNIDNCSPDDLYTSNKYIAETLYPHLTDAARVMISNVLRSDAVRDPSAALAVRTGEYNEATPPAHYWGGDGMRAETPARVLYALPLDVLNFMAQDLYKLTRAVTKKPTDHFVELWHNKVGWEIRYRNEKQKERAQYYARTDRCLMYISFPDWAGYRDFPADKRKELLAEIKALEVVTDAREMSGEIAAFCKPEHMGELSRRATALRTAWAFKHCPPYWEAIEMGREDWS